MNLLTGEFKNTLDEKGRISLPARMRSELPGTTLILTQGIDDCLWLFPPLQWEELSGKLMEHTSPFQARSRLIQRRILAPAQEVEIDRLGRISIPQSLREFARLSRECVILGISKYIEIWNADDYRAYLDANKEEFAKAAEELQGVHL
jgi:MraZ protein